MKRIWPILLILVAFALIYFVQLDPQSGDEPPAGDVAVMDEDVLAEAPELVEDPAAIDVQREEAPLPVELQVLPAPQIDGDSITIEVWNAETRTAVPLARLILAPEGFSSKSAAGEPSRRERLMRDCEIYRCDENGQLQVPRSWLSRWAGAEADGLWGTARLLESDMRKTVRIAVASNRSLTVKVVNAKGAAQADVRVQFAGARYGSLNTLLEAKTDRSGTAILENVNDPQLHFYQSGGFVLLAGNPASPPAGQLKPLSEIPLVSELVLGETARLELKIVDLAGNSIGESRAVNLRLVESGKDPVKETRTKAFTHTQQSEGGRCVFTEVPIDRPIAVEIDFEEVGDIEVFAIEPLKKGETRKLTLRQVNNHPSLSCRVLDADGTPLANQLVTFAILGDLEYQARIPLQSLDVLLDENGVGQILLAQAKMEKGDDVIFERLLSVTLPPKDDSPMITGNMDISKEFAPGNHDLGDLSLQAKSRVAFGQVVDAIGKPIAGVRVSLSQSKNRQLSATSSAIYSDHFGGSVITGADGSFELLDIRQPKGKAEINVYKKGYPRVKTDWLGAYSAHHVVIDAGLIIQGEVLLPDVVSKRGLQVLFHPGSPTGEDAYSKYSHHSASGGEFRINGLPSELGYIEIGVGGAWPFPVLATIENVHPWRQGEEGDERLLPLDLRDSLHVFHVDVVDEGGQPISSVSFTKVRRTNGGTSSSGTSSVDGSTDFVSVDDFYEVTIKADGFRAENVKLVTAETTVTLRRPLKVQFELEWMPELEKGQSVAISLSPLDGSHSVGLMEESNFNANGILTTNISRPGRYSVSLGFHAGHSSSTTFLYDGPEQKKVIEVRETPELQKFKFNPQADFYEMFQLPNVIYD